MPKKQVILVDFDSFATYINIESCQRILARGFFFEKNFLAPKILYNLVLKKVSKFIFGLAHLNRSSVVGIKVYT